MMGQSSIETIARAVLYEGYVLYPYRTSSLKNSRPAMMGTLYPACSDAVQTGMERADLRMECLLLADDEALISTALRFLQLKSAEAYESSEQQVVIEALAGDCLARTISRSCVTEDRVLLTGNVEMSGQRLSSGAIKLTVLVRNTSSMAAGSVQPAVLHAFHSAHVAVTIDRGEFVSLTDPPAYLVEEAASCRNDGVWPVLIGDRGIGKTILASPIVLPDYPAIAPESPGDLHDSSEIDEILTLRILTMTDEEKVSARASGERAREIVDRSESLTRQNLARLHGAFRAPPARWSAWDTGLGPASGRSVRVQGRNLTIGDRVMLHPRSRADILDSLLEGRAATVSAIEQDLEDRIHVAVVIDDDPGRDLGEQSQPGHRFFFSPDELEALRDKATEAG